MLFNRFKTLSINLNAQHVNGVTHFNLATHSGNLLHLTWPFNLCDFLNDEYFHRQSGMIRVSNVRLIQLNLISCLHMTSAKDDVEDSRDKKLKKAWEKKWAWMECQNDSKKVCKSFLQSIKISKNQDSNIIITWWLKRRVHLTFLRRKNFVML